MYLTYIWCIFWYYFTSIILFQLVEWKPNVNDSSWFKFVCDDYDDIKSISYGFFITCIWLKNSKIKLFWDYISIGKG